MPDAAEEYVIRVGAEIEHGYPGDCVRHAHALAALLDEEGHEPSILRVRDVSLRPDGSTFHGALSPVRLRGRHAQVWNTHYVCCANGAAYDPLAGGVVPIDTYATTVFGRDLQLEVFPEAADVARLLRTGGFRDPFRPAANRSLLRLKSKVATS